MTTYQTGIIQPIDNTPPFPQIFLSCTFPGCSHRFVLPSPTVYADLELPKISEIGAYAALDGWSTHPDTGEDLCACHPYGTPVAEIESHEAAQVSTDTAEIDVDAVKAALEEGEDDGDS